MKIEFFDLFFPRFCLGCGYVGSYICPTCESKMKRVKRARCFYCDSPSLFGLTHPGCKRNKGIDGCLSLYAYDGLFKKLLLEAKYKGAYAVLRTLLLFSQQNMSLDLNKWKSLFNPLVSSVPLHPQRMRERGFNQSNIIVKHYFDTVGLVNENILERTVNTNHLANIGDKNKRRHHIRGAFAFIGKSAPQTALLVDDVITSGSTILECSKVLKENGVQTVLAFSLAKG